jgi:tyrosyl-tRNA synthetase
VRQAKRVLAIEATTLAHGAEAAAQADAAARAMVAGAASADMPTHTLSAPARVVEVLRDAGLTKSIGEARRLLRGGGVRLDNDKVTDEDASLEPGGLGSGVVLRVGKKKAVRVIPA